MENNSNLERRVKETVKELLNNTKIYEDEDYYDIDEINTTSAIDGYNTPNAFGKKGSKNEKFKVLLKGKSLQGYTVVNEEIDSKDIKLVKLIIRDEVADILKTIWLKRSAWK